VELVLDGIRRRLAVAALLQVVAVVATLTPFVALTEVARGLLSGAPPGDVWRWVVVAVVAFAVRFVAAGAATTVTHLADADNQHRLRRTMAVHLTRLPLGWFTSGSTGRVQRAVSADVDGVHHLVGHAVLEIVAAALTPVLVIAYLFVVDWRLALAALVPLVGYAVVYTRMVRGYGAHMRELDAAGEEITSAAVEFVRGITVVRAFGQDGTALRRYTDAAGNYARRFAGWVGPMIGVEAVSATAIAAPTVLLVVAAAGTGCVAAGWTSPADVLPALLLAPSLGEPIAALGHGSNSIRTAKAAAGRITDLVNLPALPDAAHPETPDGLAVEFDDVHFRYAEDAPDALRGISFRAEPGRLTALVGPSGSGKSTAASLIARFGDAHSGRVLLGGADVRRIPTADLLRTVGLVLQDVTLLSASIADNIRLGRPDASFEELVAAARAAQVHDRVLELPAGYDSVVGRDVLLSGGEQQRVSVARALLANPGVLVLDEATSYADAESEAAVQEAISHLVRGRTVVVVAHRLASVTGADRIVVLEAGRVHAVGTHEELLATAPLYQELWNSERAALEAVS
jgi:ATP-binding cassette, subfamily B, bacterial IrtA/YbtP